MSRLEVAMILLACVGLVLVIAGAVITFLVDIGVLR